MYLHSALIASPFSNGPDMLRNPANKSKGKLVTLADFLEFSQQKKVLGILISIKVRSFAALHRMENPYLSCHVML